MSDTESGTVPTLVTLYPTSLSDKFEAQGGSEYHIIEGIKNIKANLATLDEANNSTTLQNQMDWIVTQLGNLAYTAGIEASGTDIDEIVDQRINEREESDAIERKIRGL